MFKKAFAVLVLSAFFAGCSSSPADVVNNVAKATGAADLKSIQYSGTGYTYTFAQNYLPEVPYPKFNARYTRMIDFEKGLSREQVVRTQFEDPPRGGGGQPLYTPASGTIVSGDSSSWGPSALALTPQGWAKAAMTSNPTMQQGTLDGQPATVVSFVKGKNKVDGYVNSQNLLERVDTWVPNPIIGDTLIETRYSDYRDFGGVKFPTKIVQKQGGFPILELTVAEVQPNASVSIDPPRAPAGAARAEAVPAGKGVWYLEGTPDPNSMAVEFNDFVVIIESSVTEARALANMEAVRKLVPNKPIRYNVNSHHHGDHAAGVRAFVSEGTSIITSEKNKQFYENVVLKNPHTLEPDRLSQNPKAAEFVYVTDKYVVDDGTRRLEVYAVMNGHAENLLFSYLPDERMLFITDIFNRFGVPRPNDPPKGIVTPYYAALGNRIKELKLDIRRVAPSHGKGVVPVAELNQTLQGKVEAPPPVLPPAD